MVKIGIIGVGGIACGVHIPGIENSYGGVITAICDIDSEKLKLVGDKLNIPQNRRFENYIDLILCGDVDAVEICTPNYLHVPMAIEAVKAGKPINVEKPLSINVSEAKKLENELFKNPIMNMMCFSYRFKPAVRYAKEILNRGLLGDVISVNVEYLKSSAFMPGRCLDWRFIKEYAGTGVLGDLGVHLIDMAQFLIGDMTRVCAETGIIVKQRKKLNSDEYGNVETDDWCHFMADFNCGAHGLFNITRCAIGHDNTIKYDIFGTKGVISFNLNCPDEMNICIGDVDVESHGMHKIIVPKDYNITQEQMFVDMVSGKECKYLPTVSDGVKCQTILDSLLESSLKGCWVNLDNN